MAAVKHKITRSGNRVLFDDHVDVLTLAENHKFCVQSVSEELGVTVIQFENILVKALSIKPKELFCRHRAILARRLILDRVDRESILEQLGFKYDSHFCREVKRFYGISPSKLTKRLVGKQST